MAPQALWTAVRQLTDHTLKLRPEWQAAPHPGVVTQAPSRRGPKREWDEADYFGFHSPRVFSWVSMIQANVPVGMVIGPTSFLPPSDSALATASATSPTCT